MYTRGGSRLLHLTPSQRRLESSLVLRRPVEDKPVSRLWNPSLQPVPWRWGAELTGALSWWRGAVLYWVVLPQGETDRLRPSCRDRAATQGCHHRHHHGARQSLTPRPLWGPGRCTEYTFTRGETNILSALAVSLMFPPLFSTKHSLLWQSNLGVPPVPITPPPVPLPP